MNPSSADESCFEQSMVEHGQVTIRCMLNLSSSFDHRFVDGYDDEAKVPALKKMLEQRETIFVVNQPR